MSDLVIAEGHGSSVVLVHLRKLITEFCRGIPLLIKNEGWGIENASHSVSIA
jgi:hypothetical protein